MPPISIWKDLSRANPIATGDQYFSDIVALSNGNFLVVWGDNNDTTADGFGDDIVGQIFDASGAPLGGTLFLNEGYEDDRQETLAKVVATENGGFAMTFNYTDGTERDQLYARFDYTGERIESFEKLIYDDDTSGSYPGGFEMTQRPDGSSVVAYTVFNGDEFYIRAVIVDSSGNVSSTFDIRDDENPETDDSDPKNPALTTLEDGRVVIAWEEKDGSDYDIEYRILNTNNTLGSIVEVNSDTDADRSVSVASLTDGGWVVTWLAGTEIRGQIYNSNGTERGSMLTLGAGDDNKSYLDVVGLKDGGFFVGWLDSSDYEVSMRGFDSDGAQATSKLDLPWQFDLDARDLSFSVMPDGRILTSWWEYGEEYSETEVYSAIIDTRESTFTAAEGVPTLARLQGGQIDGNIGTDYILGHDGKDYLRGLGGKDTLWGENNMDTLNGGKDADNLYGGKGHDTLNGEKGHDSMWGGKGNDAVNGGLGNDKGWGGVGIDVLKGGDGTDELRGDGGNDKLYGDAGNDKLWGGAGNDKLWGGAGNDLLRGEGGKDKLYGNGGNDMLWGGGKADVFVFAKDGGTDTIKDFKKAGSLKLSDKLMLNDNLWSGNLSAQKVVDNYATKAGGDITFEFNGGEKLILENYTNLGALDNLIEII